MRKIPWVRVRDVTIGLSYFAFLGWIVFWYLT